MGTASFIRTLKLIELLREADPQLNGYVTVGADGLQLGSSPVDPVVGIDFASERVLQARTDSFGMVEGENDSGKSAVSRTSGRFWFMLSGKRHECFSLKDLLRKALLAMESTSPGTLKKLAERKKRTKRIVAQDRLILFDQTHLAAKFSEELSPGWYFGTNNSAKEVDAWLLLAAECAGLSRDQFQTSI